MTDGTANILVVDDEEGIREVIKENMEERGHTCYTAPNGDAALQVLATETVDLALIDVMMPGMTGISLFEQVKQLYPEMAVIFVTAVDDLNLAVEQLKGGSYDYIVKPVTRKRLQEAVDEALDKYGAILEETEHQRQLEDEISSQSEELEAKVRELSALNRMFQAEISERFTTEEAEYLKVQASRESHVRRNMMFIQESDKKRISEYLHGRVQTKLLAVQQALSACQELVPRDAAEAAASLEKIKSDLRGIQEGDIRQASHDLYPYIVTIGLVPALRSLTDRLRQSMPLELRIEPEISRGQDPNLKSLPEEFKVAVYRIAQEALGNVAQHADANNTSVELSYEEGRLALEVTDDGRGFDSDKATPAFGLVVIRDYTEALGGSCQIMSAPAQGTSVRVTVPLSPCPQ